MSLTPPTPLQVWLSVFYDLLGDAKGELDGAAWSALLSIVSIRLRFESERVAREPRT